MKKHFILAEDDEDDVLLFTEAIKQADIPIDVTTVIDCDNIIIHISPQNLPELILLDTSLPGKSTLECIEAIRTNYSAEQLPVVILSTSISPGLQEKGYAAGFNLIIQKPSTFDDIKNLVRKLYSMNWAAHPVITPDEFYQLSI